MSSSKSLIERGAKYSFLSQKALDLLLKYSRPDISLGVDPFSIQAPSLTTINVLLDDSGSMGVQKAAVLNAMALFIDVLYQSPKADHILLMKELLNRGLLDPYELVEACTELSSARYVPDGMTPLYDGTLRILSTAVAKRQELAEAGKKAVSLTLIVSDSFNNTSTSTLEDVATVVKELDAADGGKTHIVAGLAVGDPRIVTEFERMGMRPVLHTSASATEIRNAFEWLARSSSRVAESPETVQMLKEAGSGALADMQQY